MESLLTEPQWILDREGSGPLFWRRDCMKMKRVKFLHDVEVLEFSRSEQELETMLQQWPEERKEPATISMGMTAFICIMVTVFLPWYLIGVI